MTSPSSERELRERALMLLYGLLDDKEAEGFRGRVATDSVVAAIYEAARVDSEFFKRVARENPLTDAERQSEERNVSVDNRPVLPFDFDAAVDVHKDDVFIDSEFSSDELREDLEALSHSKRKKVGTRKKRETKRSHEKQNEFGGETFLKQDSSIPTQRRGSISSGITILLKALDSGVARLFSTFWKSPIFSILFTLTLVLFLVVALGVFQRDRLASRYFFNDFRIQIALPKTLVRGIPQTIVVKTTGVDGKPRRVSARFHFFSLDGGFELVHTESGNGDGNLVYNIPDLSDFPDRVELSIEVGSSETESFRTSLSVVDSSALVQDRRLRMGKLDEGDSVLTPDLVSSALGVLAYSSAPKRSSLKIEESSEELQHRSENISERSFVRFYPEGGRFVEGIVNRANAYCSDNDGFPLQRNIIIFQEDVKEPAINIATDSFGFGTFLWKPTENLNYFATLTASGEASDISDFSNLTNQNVESRDRFEGCDNFSTTISFDPTVNGGLAHFHPRVERESAYLSLNSRVFQFNESLKAQLTTSAKTPLLVAVERQGAIVSEQFLPTSGDKANLDLEIPDSLVGFFRVALYRVARGKVQKISETPAFRRGESASKIELVAEIAETAREGESPKLLLRVTRRNSKGDSNIQSFFENEKLARVDIFWTPDLESAMKLAEPDLLLDNMDDKLCEEIVQTSSNSLVSDYPIVFDNLEALMTSSSKKLEHFEENEARNFLRVARLVFICCFAIAMTALFFTIFKATSLSQCLSLFLLVILLFAFAQKQRNILDAFFKSSQDVASAMDEDESRSLKTGSTSSKPDSIVFANSQKARENERVETKVSVSNATLDFKSGFFELPLGRFLNKEEQSQGWLLIKLEGDAFSAETLVPLPNIIANLNK